LRDVARDLAFAAELAHGEFVLRVNRGLTDWHVDNVIDILKDALDEYRDITKD
jgi:hypothetical protein